MRAGPLLDDRGGRGLERLAIATGWRSPFRNGRGATAVSREIAIRHWPPYTFVRSTLLLTILFAAYPVAETPVKVNSAAGTGGSPFAGCARNWITK
jgi:hypothetical protein